MIIQINNDYRLVGYRYGWRIEEKGKKGWKESRPAYPASLPRACEAVAERILANGTDTDLNGAVQRLTKAASDVRKAFELARKAA